MNVSSGLEARVGRFGTALAIVAIFGVGPADVSGPIRAAQAQVTPRPCPLGTYWDPMTMMCVEDPCTDPDVPAPRVYGACLNRPGVILRIQPRIGRDSPRTSSPYLKWRDDRPFVPNQPPAVQYRNYGPYTFGR